MLYYSIIEVVIIVPDNHSHKERMSDRRSRELPYIMGTESRQYRNLI